MDSATVKTGTWLVDLVGIVKSHDRNQSGIDEAMGYPFARQGCRISHKTRRRTHLLPDARRIHRKRTTNRVLKINGTFFQEIKKILNYSQT